MVEQNFDLEDNNLECVSLKIKSNLNKELNLLVPYIPPGKDDQLKLFSDKLSGSRLKNVIVMGDLNAKSMEWNNAQGNSGGIIVEEMLTKCNLICMNDGQPTRRNSSSVIDLVLCSAELVQYSRECSILSHEKVRSDHIAIFFEADFDLTESSPSIKVVRPIKKRDWRKWQETTEIQFEDFEAQSSGNLEEDYARFCELMQGTMDTVIPQKTVKIRQHATRPCWWNEEVQEAKTEMNSCQKKYKQRNTVQNKEKLLEAESNLEDVKEKAQDEWTDRLLTSFESATSSKDRWDIYRKLTEKKEENTVLPLMRGDGKPVFAKEEKCELLKDVFFKGSHLKDNCFDKDFYTSTNEKCQMVKENLDLSEGVATFNTDIVYEEVEAAIQRLKAGKSPGPDDMYPELFMNASENLKKGILYIFNSSWSAGQLPLGWRCASVKFLRKQGKTDYYSPSSYRPISLTSVLCKLMERIVLSRLEAYVEGKRLLDEEQQGFRRFHYTTYAVPKLVQSIREGFGNKESTLACFIDLEKAYNSVWREGLMVKLSKLGIKGRMWGWIFSFLSDRKGTCKIGEFIGGEFTSCTGLPQGSVISPLLFNIFIMDMFEEVTGAHTSLQMMGLYGIPGKM